MTDQEINVAIAELCGWKREPYNADYWQPKSGASFVHKSKLPDYCNDLNAMHEAENIILELGLMDGLEGYHNILCGVIDNANAIRATARQRCEAFLRTKNQWPPGQGGKE